MKDLKTVFFLSGLVATACALPTAGGSAVVVMPPASIVVAPAANISSVRRAHFWGYDEGRPVYSLGDEYIYWRRSGWVAMSQLPSLKPPPAFFAEPPVELPLGLLIDPARRETVPDSFWR
jgi:hypothetical protein